MPSQKRYNAQLTFPVPTEWWVQIAALAAIEMTNKAIVVRRFISIELPKAIDALPPEKRQEFERLTALYQQGAELTEKIKKGE